MNNNKKLPPIGRHHHWHYLYARRRQRVRALGINPKQMAWSQVFSLVGSIIAGLLLETNKTTLAFFVGVFVILPGVFDLNGSLGASLSAKINHRLEASSAKLWRVFVSSVGFACLVAALSGVIVASLGAGIATLFFEAIYWKVFMIGWGAILLSAVIGFPLIGGLSVFFRLRDVNPDDVVGPIESSVFDILTILTLTLMVRLLI